MKPILFNTDMVRAILDGRKTVTRRVVRPQPKARIAYTCMGYKHGTWSYPGEDAWKYWGEDYRLPETLTKEEREMRWTPPFRGDDILYVRETFAYGYVDTTDFECRCNECFFEELKAGTKKDSFLMPRYFYRTEDLDGLNVRWRPSIHMPKEAARLFLRVKKVSVERLREISALSAMDEGFTDWNDFVKLWNRTIKPADRDKYGWNANPLVWVISFERISREAARELVRRWT